MTTHILVVNDTQDILEIFRMLLEDEGYTVTLSSFPLQKAGEIKRINPDLIILDVVFGEEKLGWQMLQLLKMQPATASIPVIICTAAEKAVREMEGYLVSKNVLVVYKPFEIEDLLTAVEQALKSAIQKLPPVSKETETKEENNAKRDQKSNEKK
ncbi:MAG: hypothetical protein NVS4B11_28250 [Ktedonobacteraceae bacterium]